MFVEDRSLNPGVETNTHPFSLDSLIAWLEKQPGEKAYCYEDDGRCLHAQYFAAHRIKLDLLGHVFFAVAGEHPRVLPRGFQQTAQSKPWTFGAALDRARALKARHG